MWLCAFQESTKHRFLQMHSSIRSDTDLLDRLDISNRLQSPSKVCSYRQHTKHNSPQQRFHCNHFDTDPLDSPGMSNKLPNRLRSCSCRLNKPCKHPRRDQ